MGFNLQFFLVLLIAAAALLILRIVFSSDGEASLTVDKSRQENQSTFSSPGAIKTHWDQSKAALVSSDLGRVRVAQLNFSHFDAVPGPPDPESFADELILELYDSVSDFRWTVTYVVATPAGIRKLMDNERWSFFHATEIFIVRRYDLQVIKEAVYGRIKEIHDQIPLDAEEPPLRG
jgi:hypothetical protein